MPYIHPDMRRQIDGDNVFDVTALTSGDLNYILTSLVDSMIDMRGLSYTTINEIVGVLECMKLELYRRVAAPYEDQKRRENGDVYKAGGTYEGHYITEEDA